MQRRAQCNFGRFISLLLTVVLVCSVIPMDVYANDEMVSLINEKQDKELNINDDETVYILQEEEMDVLEETPVSQQEEVTESTLETNAEESSSSQTESVMVFFDFNADNYGEYYVAMVPVGGTVTDKPADPERDGYLFLGWYGYLDENDEPVLWDFNNEPVQDNMSLWAAWEKAYTVAFDPDDGTQYQDFYKTTVPAGGTITHKPSDPVRDGYLFQGWYGHLDENDAPVLWDFASDIVTENTTLWAAWKEENNGGDGEGDNGNNGGGTGDNGGSTGGGNGDNGGNTGGSGDGNKTGPVVSEDSGNQSSININDQEVPNSSADTGHVTIDEQEVPKDMLGKLPKTGEDHTFQIIYRTLIVLSLFLFGICLPFRKKRI